MNVAAGRAAREDLTSGKMSVVDSTDLAHRFIGGRGINSLILLNELASGVDPLSLANILVFGDGTLVGSMKPAACYTSFGSKNLPTGGINYTHAGGHFAPALKQAGLDNLVVSDHSERPVHLYLHNGKSDSLYM